MNDMRRYLTAVLALSIVVLSAVASCTKAPVNPGEKPDEKPEVTNQFAYDDQIYNIRSVVRYESETSVEFWLSSRAGLTSIGDLKKADDYAVVSVSKSFLGSTDYFAKTNTYVRFNELRFDNSYKGMGYIQADMTEDKVYLNFKIEKLYENGKAVEKQLQGSYEGGFVDHFETLDNQWSANMVPKSLGASHVDYITTEEYGVWKSSVAITLFDAMNPGYKALKITIPEDKLGADVIDIADIQSIEYDGGKSFNLINRANIRKFNIAIDENKLTVSLSLAAGGNFLAAEYKGTINTFAESKPNHIAWKLSNSDEVVRKRFGQGLMFYKHDKVAGEYTFRFAFSGVDSILDENLPTLVIPSNLTDGEYHYNLGSDVGKFGYKENVEGGLDLPMMSIIGATVMVKIEDSMYTIIFKQPGRVLNATTTVDLEVFYYGTYKSYINTEEND